MTSRSKDSLEWVFPLNPVAASRPRLSKGRGGRPHAYYAGPYKRFISEAASVVDEVFSKGYPLLEGPLHVSLQMNVKKPKTTKFDYPKWDVDNGIKACLDCLNKKLWVDDSQIISIDASKRWAEDGKEGHFIVSVLEQ